MRARANRYVASLLAAGVGVLALPALAAAGSGGAASGSGGSTAGATPSTAPPVEPGNTTVSASGDGITLQTKASAFVRSGVSVTGTVPTGNAGSPVEIDQLPATPGAAWTEVAVVQPQSNGSFATTVHTTRAGPLTIRAEIQGSQASSATAAPPSISVTVYKRSIATLYGPGFWGHRTACGVVLRRRTIGVANRTLPCGTEVQLYWKGGVITVPVIDRGPYAHNANWDLTMATARALGMEGTGVVGAAALPLTTTSTGAGTTSGSGAGTPTTSSATSTANAAGGATVAR
ncbi:MAG TPA: septal ring lytic transglycosylase RlpA family protein [Solirubrobacteraceae bacterium]|nr:septal ring lytic transglycosylase RlpA family protein [Solirubrobacteraceae bacterium]